MSMKVLHLAIFILMSGLTSGLPLEVETRHRRDADSCSECPAGTYQASCNKCEDCPDNTFTNKINKENSCHYCFMDCVAELHMQVLSSCTKKSNVVCECMKGYFCPKRDRYTGQCIKCEQQPSTQKAQTSSHTVSPTSTQQTNLTSFAWITQPPRSTTSTLYEKGTMMKLGVFFLAIISFIVFIFIMVYFCKGRKISCLKKSLKQCSLRKEDIKAISSKINNPITPLQDQRTHTQTPSITSTDDSNPQPDSREKPPSASGNLGPLYIYGASTVFVSLLNQFGLNGGNKEEEDIPHQTLNSSEMHCPPSPTIPLSKEERSRDVSFPSQEQGKECHMSKEEGL